MKKNAGDPQARKGQQPYKTPEVASYSGVDVEARLGPAAATYGSVPV